MAYAKDPNIGSHIDPHNKENHDNQRKQQQQHQTKKKLNTSREDVLAALGYGDLGYGEGHHSWKPTSITIKDACHRCSKKVYPVEKIDVGVLYHKSCFKCKECGTQLTLKNFQRELDSNLSSTTQIKEVYCNKHVPKQTNVALGKDALGIKTALDAQKRATAKGKGTEQQAGWQYDSEALEFQHARDVTRKKNRKLVRRRSTLRSFQDFEKYGVFDAQSALEVVHREEEDELYRQIFDERKLNVRQLEKQLFEEKEITVKQLIAYFEKRGAGKEERDKGFKQVEHYFKKQTQERSRLLLQRLAAEEEAAVTRMIEKHSQEMLLLIAEKAEIEKQALMSLSKEEREKLAESFDELAFTEDGPLKYFREETDDQAGPGGLGDQEAEKRRDGAADDDQEEEDMSDSEEYSDDSWEEAQENEYDVEKEEELKRKQEMEEYEREGRERIMRIEAERERRAVEEQERIKQEKARQHQAELERQDEESRKREECEMKMLEQERLRELQREVEEQNAQNEQERLLREQEEAMRRARELKNAVRPKHGRNTSKRKRDKELEELRRQQQEQALKEAQEAQRRREEQQQERLRQEEEQREKERAMRAAAEVKRQRDAQQQEQKQREAGETGRSEEAQQQERNRLAHEQMARDKARRSIQKNRRDSDEEDDDAYPDDDDVFEDDRDITVVVSPPKTKKRDLYTSPKVFEVFDRNAIEEAKKDPKSFTNLVRNLSVQCQTELQKVRAIFRWVTAKDLNKMKFSDTIDPKSLFGLLRGIKYGTESYHNLFKRLCSYAGLHCEVISGFSKGAGYKPGARFRGHMFRNQWTAVCVDGSWRFINCNWGARHIKGPGDDLLTYKCDEFYFLTDPQDHIYQHFPDHKQWQLLNHPLSIDDFIHLPVLKSPFFNSGLGFNLRYDSVLNTHDGTVELHMTMPKLLGFAVKLYSRSKSKNKTFPDDMLQKRTMIRTLRKEVVFTVNLPSPGHYFWDMYVSSDWSSQSMDHACGFQINCTDVSRDAHLSYPQLGCFGKTQAFLKYHFKEDPDSGSNNDPYIRSCGEQSLTLSFSRDLKFSHTLQLWDNHDRDLQDFDRYAILRQREDKFATFLLRCPKRGHYVFTVYASKAKEESASMECVYRYFIDCRVPADHAQPMPKVSKRWHHCKLIEPLYADLAQETNIKFKIQCSVPVELAVVHNNVWTNMDKQEGSGDSITYQAVLKTAARSTKVIICGRFDTSRDKFVPLVEYKVKDSFDSMRDETHKLTSYLALDSISYDKVL